MATVNRQVTEEPRWASVGAVAYAKCGRTGGEGRGGWEQLAEAEGRTSVRCHGGKQMGKRRRGGLWVVGCGLWVHLIGLSAVLRRGLGQRQPQTHEPQDSSR